MKTPPNVILPDIEEIKDERIKVILKKYNEIFFEIIPALYSDMKEVTEKIEELENK